MADLSARHPFDGWGLKVANSKCFAELPQGFEEIRPINIVVGQNNSGKTTLLESVASAATGAPLTGRNANQARLHYRVLVDEKMLVDGNYARKLSQHFTKQEIVNCISSDCIDLHFNPNGQVNPHTTGRIFEYSESQNSVNGILGRRVSELTESNGSGFQSWPPAFHSELAEPVKEALLIMDALRACEVVRLNATRHNPFDNSNVFKLLAHRLYRPEQPSSSVPESLFDGRGEHLNQYMHLAIHRQINNLNTRVNTDLLGQLNYILGGEDRFRSVSTIQHASNNMFETVFFGTGSNLPDYVSLSQCGSGMATVFHVLAAVLLFPDEVKNESKSGSRRRVPKSYNLFLFEELENNLHPTVLRRLLEFIEREAAVSTGTFFLTTHSPVVIDFFAGKENSQIVHVEKAGAGSHTNVISDRISSVRAIDDLGHRPSDVLQSNCIVWVEGPSDIYYFNKWIEIWTAGQLKCGVHYTCLMYVGDHADFFGARGDGQDSQEAVLIDFVNINTRTVFICDSDRDCCTDDVKKEPFKRIVSEVAGIGGYTWVTAGREIENYMSEEMLSEMFGETISIRDQYEDIPSKLKGMQLVGRKVPLAKKSMRFWNRERIEACSDLRDNLIQVVEFIRNCNHIK